MEVEHGEERNQYRHWPRPLWGPCGGGICMPIPCIKWIMSLIIPSHISCRWSSMESPCSIFIIMPCNYWVNSCIISWLWVSVVCKLCNCIVMLAWEAYITHMCFIISICFYCMVYIKWLCSISTSLHAWSWLVPRELVKVSI